jgi:hypothetical protein
MGTAIKHVLAYFAILNFIAPVCVATVVSLYGLLAHGAFVFNFISPETIVPTQLTGMLLMVVYLYANGVLGIGSSRVKPLVMLSSVGAWLGAYWLVSLLMAYSKWIPDIMEQTFDNILSTPLGIFSIAVVGPVVEELLFRRAVTDALLKQYSEQRAIVVSALIFGLFHINPAQIVPAFLMGILFAWIYCRTRSLIPTIVVHILSNSLSVYFLTRPNPIEDITQLFSAGSTIALTVASAALLFLSIKCIAKSEK